MLNVFDIGIILVLIMCFIAGFKNGVIREVVATIGIILVFILSFALKGVVGNFLCRVLPFFKITGVIEGFSSINILIYQSIAFILVFGILLILYEFLLKVSRFLQKIVNLTIVLIIPSKILGGIVGVIKGIIVLFVVLVVLMIPFGNIDMYKNSSMVNRIVYNTPVLSSYTSSFVDSIDEVYELGKRVSKSEITNRDANREELDIMLKRGIVDKGTVIKLRDQHKLDDIDNINSIINKY